MRKMLIITGVLLLSYSLPKAQDILDLRTTTGRTIKKEADTTKWVWKHGGLINANLSQGSLSNWAAGGDNFTLAVTSYFNYYFFYRKGKYTWDNNLDVNFGYVQSTGGGVRKNDDRVDYLSKYGYRIDGGKWYLSTLFNFRTQMFDGFTYNNGPAGDLSSTLLSPAYFLLSAGFDYKPSAKFSAFLSPLTSRTTVVTSRYLSEKGLYGVDTGRHASYQVGSFVTFNYLNSIGKNITYRGRVDLFSNYLNDPQDVDFYMTNLLTFKINRYLSATYSLDFIYDDEIRLFGPHNSSPGLQTKSLLGIGFLMPLRAVKHV